MNSVRITYLGHACFSMEVQGYRIVIDPYKDYMIPGLPPLRLTADAVFCSHQHEDHNFTAAVTLTNTDQPLPCGVETITVPHDPENGRLRGMSAIHIFNFSGIRIAHMGDIGRMLTEEEAAKLQNLDALMIPVGGTYTVDADQAGEILKQLSPRAAIPMHYRTDEFGLSDIDNISRFLRDREYTYVEEGTLELPLPLNQKIYVLNYKRR